MFYYEKIILNNSSKLHIFSVWILFIWLVRVITDFFLLYFSHFDFATCPKSEFLKIFTNIFSNFSDFDNRFLNWIIIRKIPKKQFMISLNLSEPKRKEKRRNKSNQRKPRNNHRAPTNFDYIMHYVCAEHVLCEF